MLFNVQLLQWLFNDFQQELLENFVATEDSLNFLLLLFVGDFLVGLFGNFNL